jgi:hypothetical protein
MVVERLDAGCGAGRASSQYGGPRFLLPNLNIIVLNKVRNISKGNINENLKRKSLDNFFPRLT